MTTANERSRRMSTIEGAQAGGVDFAAMRDRFQQMREQKFATIDADGSGGLSLEELQTAAAESPFADKIKDRDMSPEERFARADTDGDGELTREELDTARQNTRSKFSNEMMAFMLNMQETGGSVAAEGAPTGGDDTIQTLLDALFNNDTDDSSDEEDKSEDSALL